MWPIFKLHNYYKYAMQFQILSNTATSHWTEIRQFVNLRKKTNLSSDLLVEHSNKESEDNFSLFRGETTQKAQDRLSKNQMESKKF